MRRTRRLFAPSFVLAQLVSSIANAGPGDPDTAGGEFTIVSGGAEEVASVGPDGSGGFVVVWQAAGGSLTDLDRRIAAQRFDGTGTPIGAPFEVNTYTTGDQRDPAVGPDGAGGFVIVWESEGSAGTDASGSSIQARRYDASGLPLGDQFQVNTHTPGRQGDPAVAADGAGGFVVVWASDSSAGTDTDGSSIQGQRYDAAGLPAGGQFQVNTYTFYFQSVPAVSPDGAGGFFVVWSNEAPSDTDPDSGSVQGRRYDAAGLPLGDQFLVNAVTAGNQTSPAIAPDGAGGVVVVWQSETGAGTDVSGTSIQGQRYDATGSPVGAQFQVNTYTTGFQTGPVVSPDGLGGFVVAWTSAGGASAPCPGASCWTDTDAHSIQRQRYDGSGAPSGPEFQVNSYTVASQLAPAVAPDGAGGFVVVWVNTGTGLDTVSGQRFGTPGAAPPTIVGVTAQKLVILDKVAATGQAKVLYRAKDATAGIVKGCGESLDDIGVVLEIAYTSAGGAFVVPPGASDGDSGWAKNTFRAATFLNRLAPNGPTGAKTAVVKPHNLVKLVGKSLGDTPIDIVSAGPPDGAGVTVAYEVANGGGVMRYCSHFAQADCSYGAVAGGLGAKLVCRAGTPTTVCP